LILLKAQPNSKPKSHNRSIVTRLTRRITRLSQVLALSAMLSGGSVHADPINGEYEQKASLVFSFIKNTEWNHSGKAGRNTPFIIGVFGNDPIADPLREYLKGTPVKNRVAFVRNIMTKEEVAGCHVLVIGRADEGSLRLILGEARREGVLTVGESDGFLKAGGVIQFVKKSDSKLGYSLKVENARREKLEPSGFLIRNMTLPPQSVVRPIVSGSDRRVAGTETIPSE
jgi:hypothetical protein